MVMSSDGTSERLEQLQDKGHGLQSLEIRSPSQKRKRSPKARSLKFIGHEVTVEHPGQIDDVEDKCAFSTSSTSTCQIRFSWTEQADRQLVIQYVKRCATLGAKYRHQICWASLPDPPAPPKNSERAIKPRGCESTRENYNWMFLISDHGTGLPEEQSDDFDNENVKEALNEVLYHLRLTKSDASKRPGPTDEEWLDLNTNAEDNVMGSDGHPLSLSPQVFPSIVMSPFPSNSRKRAAKFARWLHKRHKELMTGGIDLPADVHCGDLFHSFALVSSGELSISPCLPDGVGEAQKLRSSQNIEGNEILNGKRLKSLVKESEITSRREKVFLGLMVSLCRTSFSIVDCENLDTSGQNEMRKTINSCIDAPVPEICSESPGEGDLHPVICNGGAHPQGTRNMDVFDVHKVTIYS